MKNTIVGISDRPGWRPRLTSRLASRLTVRLAGAALAAVGLLAPASGRAAASADATPAPVVRPELRWRLDAPLAGAGATLLAASLWMDAAPRTVPPQGLDPRGVHWSYDRSLIGERSTRAADESDYARNVALVYPMAVAFFSQPSGARWNGTIRRGATYTEALLLAEGIGVVLKNSADRPRPFTYLAAAERPSDSRYDVTRSEAFRSMPSGHAIASFCAAGFAMTDHLLSRPDAGRLERCAVPFVGGALAGATAAGRVEAGQHFPSDVIVGGLIGASSGVVVPLLHRYVGADGSPAPAPSGRSCREAIVSLLAGIGAGVLIGQSLH